MALVNKPLTEIVSFTRGTASTFIDSDGVVKGISVSITPNTIGLGTKTFILQGGIGQDLGFDLNNRVRMMETSSGTSEMQGTVVSYNMTTQVIQVNVTSVIGSGSFSNWRIGTLEPVFTFDETTLAPEGIQTEQAFTNLLQYSRQLENGYWSRLAGGTGLVPTLQPNAALAPDGTFSAARLVLNKGAGATTTDNANFRNGIAYSQVAGLPYTAAIWIRSATASNYSMRLEPLVGSSAQTKAGRTDSLITVTPTWQRFETANYAAANTASANLNLVLRGAQGTSDFADVYIWQPQVTQSFFCNTDIPSATAFTSRASGGTRFNRSGVLSGFDTSTTSNTVGTGPRTFTLGATANVDRGYVVGETLVRAGQSGTPANFVQGLVTAYNPATQSLTIEVTTTGGTGTISSWSLSDRGARFTYNPANLAHGPNLQLEPAATNLFPSSEVIANGVGTTVTQNTTIAPDGATTADTANEDTSTGEHYINDVAIAAPVVGTYYTWSTFVKAGTGDRELFIRTAGNVATVRFNLATGQLGVATGVGGSYVSSFVYALPNGFYRVGITILITASVSTTFRIQFITSAGATVYTGDPANSLIIWGRQLETGTSPTSYIPTAGAQVTRAADVATSIATVRNADTLQITGSNFSQFYNPTQGTWVASFKPDANMTGTALSVNDGTDNNAMRVTQRAYPLFTYFKGISNGSVDLIGTNQNGGALIRNDGISFNPRFTGETLAVLAVAYDGVSKFLSTGSAETIIETALDGVANTVRSINTAHQGVFFGGPANLFVVAGNTGRISISPDGLAWERIQTPETVNQLLEVSASPTTYVAVGNTGVIYTSTDARTWTPRISGTTNNLSGVTWSGSLFAVSRAAANNNVLTSPDGITWTIQTTAVAQNQNDIHFANGLFVSVGSAGTIQTSTNGTTWTAATSNTTNVLRGVTYDPASGLWVAVGDGGTVVYSTTPTTTWTNGTANSGTTGQILEVIFFNGLFVATGSQITTNSAASIQAGGVWANRTSNVNSSLAGLATNGSIVVATGSGNGITTSPDGITWTSRTGNGNTMNGVAYGANTWVVCGNPQGGSGVIATVSNNGVYQRRVSNTTQTIRAGIFAGGRFVFGADGGVIVTSTDGITWTAVTVGGTTTSFNHVAYNGSLYVAMGTSGRFSTSTDGLTWTAAANSASGSAMNGLAFDQGIFVAVGSSGATQTSTNGTTWTARASGTTVVLTGVHYSTRDGVWYAYGTNTILRSPDAITWTDAQGDTLLLGVSSSQIQSFGPIGKFSTLTSTKIAMSYENNTVRVSVNGGPVSTNTFDIPSFNRLSLGMNGLQQDYFNGSIQSIRYINSSKTNEELQSLSI